jgi:apolipoprotein N-acyltransferase
VHARFARTSPVLLAVAAPAAWLAIDWFRCELWPLRFAWFTLGHALSGHAVLRQNADMAGVHGLTLFAFVTSFALERAFAFRRDGRAFVLVLLVLGANAALFARGNRVLGFTPKKEPRSLDVLAIQDEHVNAVEPKKSLTIAAIGTRAPDVILWPEDCFFVDYTKTKYVPDLAEVARLASQAFIFGSMRDLEGGRQRNAAVVLGPDGRTLGEYDKRVPVQFVESAVPGDRSPIFSVASARLGVMICYDGTYPFVARDLVHAGAEVLLVPTMDVAHWGRIQHEHHALFYALRACELRRPIVRAASSGVTLALDAWGRTVARVEPFDPASLRAVVHPNDAMTPYARGGWLLPAVASAIALLGLAATVRKR